MENEDFLVANGFKQLAHDNNKIIYGKESYLITRQDNLWELCIMIDAKKGLAINTPIGNILNKKVFDIAVDKIKKEVLSLSESLLSFYEKVQ